jgi:hypothetical protein
LARWRDRLAFQRCACSFGVKIVAIGARRGIHLFFRRRSHQRGEYLHTNDTHRPHNAGLGKAEFFGSGHGGGPLVGAQNPLPSTPPGGRSRTDLGQHFALSKNYSHDPYRSRQQASIGSSPLGAQLRQFAISFLCVKGHCQVGAAAGRTGPHRQTVVSRLTAVAAVVQVVTSVHVCVVCSRHSSPSYSSVRWQVSPGGKCQVAAVFS